MAYDERRKKTNSLDELQKELGISDEDAQRGEKEVWAEYKAYKRKHHITRKSKKHEKK